MKSPRQKPAPPLPISGGEFFGLLISNRCFRRTQPLIKYRICREKQVHRLKTSMPSIPYVERHFTGTEVVRDIVIEISDGLTLPFALAVGLS